jgi:hypothetical protein
VRELLPGLGEPITIAIAGDSPALDRSLAELDLRGQTGATVIVIVRGDPGLLVPGARCWSRRRRRGPQRRGLSRNAEPRCSAPVSGASPPAKEGG